MNPIKISIEGPITLNLGGPGFTGSFNLLDSITNLIKGELLNMQNKLDTSFSQLRATVTALTTVEESASALISGFNQKLVDAVEAAKAAGATDAQLQGFTDLNAELVADTSKLAAAVANMPGTPAPIPAPVGGAPGTPGTPAPVVG